MAEGTPLQIRMKQFIGLDPTPPPPRGSVDLANRSARPQADSGASQPAVPPSEGPTSGVSPEQLASVERADSPSLSVGIEDMSTDVKRTLTFKRWDQVPEHFRPAFQEALNRNWASLPLHANSGLGVGEEMFRVTFEIIGRASSPFGPNDYHADGTHKKARMD